MGCLPHVCFPPNSDRTADIAGGPVGAKTGSGRRKSWELHRCASAPDQRHTEPVSIMALDYEAGYDLPVGKSWIAHLVHCEATAMRCSVRHCFEFVLFSISTVAIFATSQL